MRKKYYHSCAMRRPRTTQERRAAQGCKYVRSKRNTTNLPNAWDDEIVADWQRKNWKNHRKNQYRDKPRGKEHRIIFDDTDWDQYWNLRDYLQDHDIPHNYDVLRKTETREEFFVEYGEYHWIRIFDENKGCYILRKKYTPYKKPKYFVRRWTKTIELKYQVTWWSDKDIGLEYII